MASSRLASKTHDTTRGGSSSWSLLRTVVGTLAVASLPDAGHGLSLGSCLEQVEDEEEAAEWFRLPS